MYGQTNRRWIYSTIQNNTIQYNTKKSYMNMGLLKHGSTLIASWWLKRMCKVSTSSFHAGIAGDRLLGHYILPLHLTGLFAMICYEKSSQSCWKMWIWRPGFVCSYAWWCSTTFFSCMLGILAHVSGTMNGMRWTTSMACSSMC